MYDMLGSILSFAGLPSIADVNKWSQNSSLLSHSEAPGSSRQDFRQPLLSNLIWHIIHVPRLCVGHKDGWLISHLVSGWGLCRTFCFHYLWLGYVQFGKMFTCAFPILVWASTFQWLKEGCRYEFWPFSLSYPSVSYFNLTTTLWTRYYDCVEHSRKRKMLRVNISTCLTQGLKYWCSIYVRRKAGGRVTNWSRHYTYI